MEEILELIKGLIIGTIMGAVFVFGVFIIIKILRII
jgi:hypothetical protein